MLFDDKSDNLIAVSKLQKDFYKILYVALASFSGVNIRIPFIKPENISSERSLKYQEIYKNFEDKFMFEELSTLRNDLADLCVKLPSLFHHTQAIQVIILLSILKIG